MKLDFNTYPQRGFLNTHFGIKLTEHVSSGKFRFSFSDGTSTSWLTEGTIIYKQFSKAGEHCVCLESGDSRIEKKLYVEDSYKLGNGKAIGFIYPNVDNIIIQKKTTGIVIYY